MIFYYVVVCVHGKDTSFLTSLLQQISKFILYSFILNKNFLSLIQNNHSTVIFANVFVLIALYLCVFCF